MTHIEVTDEMAMRAWRAYMDAGHDADSYKAIRAALQAALNPPPELEIEVSDGMHRAAQEWLQSYGPDAAKWLGSYAYESIYRAMEAQRRKEQFGPLGLHKRHRDGD